MPEPRPEQAAIMRRLDELRRYYRRRDEEIRRDVELYNLDFKLDLPKGFHQVKAPTTKAICDRAADRLGAGRVQTHIDPRRPGKAERDHVEQLERACPAILWLARKRRKSNPMRQMALHAFNRGGWVAKMQLDLTGLEELEETGGTTAERKRRLFQRMERFPLILDVRPIESIYPDPETDGDNVVFEHYNRRLGDIKRNYPGREGWWDSQVLTSRRKVSKWSDDTVLRYTEVWTPDWRAALVEDQFVPIGDMPEGPVPNLMGRPPYWQRLAGFGDDSGEPHNRVVSILRGIRDTSRSMSRLLSIVDALAESDAYGALVAKEGDRGIDSFELAPGVINPMEHPELVKPVRIESNLPAVLQGLGVMQAQAEIGAVPSEAIGQPSPVRRGAPASGIVAAITTGQASMLIDPVKDALELFLSDFFPFSFYVLDAVVAEELPLYAQVGRESYVQLTLSPKVIDGHYGPVYVELKLRAPEEDYARWQLGVTAIQVMGPQPWIFERFFGMENAEELVKEMSAHQLASSPPVQQYMAERLVALLQAKIEGLPDMVPGQRVAAPAGEQVMAPGPVLGEGFGPRGQQMPQDAGLPQDALANAEAGVARSPLPGGPPITAPAALTPPRLA